MKKILLIIIGIAPIALFSQSKNFTVKGKVGNLNSPALVYLTYVIDGKRTVDSTVLNNGDFEFNGIANEPVQAALSLYHQGRTSNQTKSNDMLRFYIEPVAMKVVSPDSLKFAVISGSKVNEDDAKLRELLKSTEDKMKALSLEYRNASSEKKKSEEYNNEIEKKYNELEGLRKQISIKFIKENPNSWVSLNSLKTNVGGYTPDYAEVEPIYNGLSAEIRNSAAGQDYAKSLNKWKSVAIGAIAPEFTQNDADGKPVKLSDFRGKYLLIDFWASWCGPCRRENPNVVKTYKEFKDKNFTVLGVSLDNEKGREAWLKAIKDDNLTWTQVTDLKYWKNEAAVLYGVQAIPDNFLLGPDGKIIARGLRGEDLKKKLTELLKK